MELTIELTDPNSELGLLALRAYFHDVASSYYRRPATEAEVIDSMLINPSDTLAPPHGFFLVALAGEDKVLGCVGLRFLPGGLGEVKRVFVAVEARGQGLSSRLMEEMQQRALAHGVTRLRLDTRHDLIAARRLYARYGFVEVPAFNDDEYAEHWFEKALVPPEP